MSGLSNQMGDGALTAGEVTERGRLSGGKAGGSMRVW